MKFGWSLIPDVGASSQKLYALLAHADMIMKECLISKLTICCGNLRLRYETNEDRTITVLHRYWRKDE